MTGETALDVHDLTVRVLGRTPAVAIRAGCVGVMAVGRRRPLHAVAG
ncbi:hypothetical protein [Geodermatophilus sabuli]|uniref:Uncharacterized protein n=1 Tax=Geodermatophilus sabuli TaxID=1564158 RepID=A0A285E618_9ACTN|nr:hypothetical protein [Geodermatophilus sabuli]MBB3082584.1 hypothetical protein [Geodermatophilus sabuli]SNX94548.1 hypothetical protein SAMN06893097_101344 [Geodermatophilus sabuli]